MDYQRIYNTICSNAKSQNRIKGQGVYYEVHHITPSCLGGKGNKTQYKTHPNLVLLTDKEHVMVHRLLHEIFPDSKPLFDAYFLMVNTRRGEYIHKVSHREAASLKVRKRNIQKERLSNKENHPMFGKAQSDESIDKNRSSQKTAVKANIFDLQSKEYILHGTYNQMYEFFKSQGISFYKGPKNTFKERGYALVNDRYYYCEGDIHDIKVIHENVGEKWDRNRKIIGIHKTNPSIVFGSIYDAVKHIKNNFKCKTPSYQNMIKHLSLNDDDKRGWEGYKFNYYKINECRI